MKRISRMLGVTLLEIMLVLAIAAMVIVMSIRYYTTTTQAQQANALVGQILAVTAAADNLAVGTGSFSGAGASNVKAIVGAASLANPWGSTLTSTGGDSTSITYKFDKLPAAVCQSAYGKLAAGKSGSRFGSASKCTVGTKAADSSLSFEYKMVPN